MGMVERSGEGVYLDDTPSLRPEKWDFWKEDMIQEMEMVQKMRYARNGYLRRKRMLACGLVIHC